MEYSTPNAIRQIKHHCTKSIHINGQPSCPLQAMSFALKYHKLDVTANASSVNVVGIEAVKTHTDYLLTQ